MHECITTPYYRLQTAGQCLNGHMLTGTIYTTRSYVDIFLVPARLLFQKKKATTYFSTCKVRIYMHRKKGNFLKYIHGLRNLLQTLLPASSVSTVLQESSDDQFSAVLQLVYLINIVFGIPKEGTKCNGFKQQSF